MEELRQICVKKLGKALDMEQCIVAKLPGMIEAATDSKLRDGLTEHLAETREHVARYGTLVEWAKTLDENGDYINALKKTLDEEEASDKKLSSAAEGGIFSAGINQAAAHK